MGRSRFLVFDLDFDITEGFHDRATALRFARWLVRGRSDDYGVFVSDERRSGEIIWPERDWSQPSVSPHSVQIPDGVIACWDPAQP